MNKSKINDLADNVYVLNLEKDSFKYDILKRKLNQKNIHHERFVGVDGWDGCRSPDKTVESFIKILDGYRDSGLYEPIREKGAHIVAHGWGAYRSAGAMGCVLSHLKIFKDAIENKYKKILLLQDDIYFHNQFEELLEEREEQIKRSSIFYLGATEHAGWMKNDWHWRNPHWSRKHHKLGYYNTTDSSLGMFAVIIDKKIFSPFIKLVEFELLACDQALALLGTKGFAGESFVSYPNLIMPDTTYSNTSSDVAGGRSFHDGNTWRDFGKWSIEQGWDYNYYDLSERYYTTEK